MKKTVRVMHHEIMSTLGRKSYVIIVFVLPLFFFQVFLGLVLFRGDKSSTPRPKKKPKKLQLEGYVDHAGIIREIPGDLPEGHLKPFPGEEAAARALSTGKIDAYYVIPEDYIEKGDLVYIDPDIRPLSSGQSWYIRKAIFVNLIGNDPDLLARTWPPIKVENKLIAPPKKTVGIEKKTPFIVPYLTAMMIMICLLLSASLLLHSIGGEKKNRVMEILLCSLTPRELITGKILGLGLLGLVQTIYWVGLGYAMLVLGGGKIDRLAGYSLDPVILGWAVVFFLLGYAIYSCLMAGMGALSPNIKESSQSVILVIWPMVFTMMFHMYLAKNPFAPFSLILSFFPLTAPAAMMIRMTAADIPFWQPLVSSIIMLGFAIFVLRAMAGLFRAQVLLSGQPFSARRYIGILLKRKPTV